MKKRKTLIICIVLVVITIITIGLFKFSNYEMNNNSNQNGQSSQTERTEENESTKTETEKTETEKDKIEKQIIEKSIELKYIEKQNLKKYEVLQLLKYGYYKSEPGEKYIQVDYTYSCNDSTDDCVYYGDRWSDEGSGKTNSVFIIYKDGKILEITKGVTIVYNSGFVFESGTIE